MEVEQITIQVDAEAAAQAFKSGAYWGRSTYLQLFTR